MGGNGGRRKKNNKKRTKGAAAAAAAAAAGKSADAQPRRSILSPDQRLRVENMHEILGEVWEPFKTAAGAIRGLETDPAPLLELEFWDSLAEAFIRYFGKTITLQVDTAGLLKAKKARAQAVAREAKNEGMGKLDGQGTLKELAGLPASEDDRLETALDQGRQHDESSGDELEGQAGHSRGNLTSDASAKQLEMLPMGAVGHLGRADRMSIIKKTVPQERRMAVLQRLFQLAQAPADEVECLVATVKELKNNSSSAEIRDVNLLETWQGVREERAGAWDHATEQVRLAAADAVGAPPVAANDARDVGTGGDSATPPGGCGSKSAAVLYEHSDVA